MNFLYFTFVFCTYMCLHWHCFVQSSLFVSFFVCCVNYTVSIRFCVSRTHYIDLMLCDKFLSTYILFRTWETWNKRNNIKEKNEINSHGDQFGHFVFRYSHFGTIFMNLYKEKEHKLLFDSLRCPEKRLHILCTPYLKTYMTWWRLRENIFV